MHTALAVHRPPRLTRRRFVGAHVGLLCLVAGCHERVTAPAAGLLVPTRASANVLDSPSSGSAEFSVTGEAPLAGDQRFVGHFPTPTVVAMTVHQDFTVTTLPPRPPGSGRLGLAGRVYAFGCSHQGEAYLLHYPDDGGYGFPFAGCQLAGQSDLMTSFSDTVLVSGMVHYGYAYDAACPYPDAACASYSGTSGVSLVRPTATLSIDGDSVRAGVLRAFPNREYTLVATPTPQQLGRFATPVQPVATGWTFKSDSGPIEADICGNGSGRVCTRAFTRSGELTLVAMVNGEQMTSPPLRVQMPALSMEVARDSVAVGDTVLVTTMVAGMDSTALSYYAVSSFDPDGRPIGFALTGSAPASDGGGVPPCLRPKPVPTHCYVVLTRPGRARVEVGALLDARGLSVSASRDIAVRGDERVVRLSVSRSTITPTARYWKLDTRTKTYTLNQDRPPDTSRTVVTVSVVDGAGAPVRNAAVTLSLMAHEASSGHDHTGGKPTGVFQTLERASLEVGPIGTGASGVAKFYYVASEVSGPVTIAATSPNAVRDTATVSVKVPGLVAMPPGTSYVFTGAIPNRHTANHFGTPQALEAFQEFADSVSVWIGEPLGINDISLADGGLFDVGLASWEIPHGYHRRGTHADIRTRYAANTVFPGKLQTRMRALWKVTLGYGEPVDEADHLHLNFYP